MDHTKLFERLELLDRKSHFYQGVARELINYSNLSVRPEISHGRDLFCQSLYEHFRIDPHQLHFLRREDFRQNLVRNKLIAGIAHSGVPEWITRGLKDFPSRWMMNLIPMFELGKFLGSEEWIKAVVGRGSILPDVSLYWLKYHPEKFKEWGRQYAPIHGEFARPAQIRNFTWDSLRTEDDNFLYSYVEKLRGLVTNIGSQIFLSLVNPNLTGYGEVQIPVSPRYNYFNVISLPKVNGTMWIEPEGPGDVLQVYDPNFPEEPAACLFQYTPYGVFIWPDRLEDPRGSYPDWILANYSGWG